MSRLFVEAMKRGRGLLLSFVVSVVFEVREARRVGGLSMPFDTFLLGGLEWAAGVGTLAVMGAAGVVVTSSDWIFLCCCCILIREFEWDWLRPFVSLLLLIGGGGEESVRKVVELDLALTLTSRLPPPMLRVPPFLLTSLISLSC
jgi:hypothetical protein